ncbi:MAG: hypothetical protein LC623_08935, partial [Halobacteriales archaeon]|nr:hypothetical protein [Halobacteriales archaeon]
RVTPLGLAPDGAPTRTEMEQVKRDLAAQGERQAQQEQKQQAVVEETTSSSPNAWRALDWFVVGLAVLNLAGLVAIARRVNQLRGPPRNPFK